MIMKALAARPQDEQDLRGMLIAQGDRIDWRYCLKVARELSSEVDQDLVGYLIRLRDANA